MMLMNKLKSEWTKWFLCFMIFSVFGWVYELLVFRFELGYGYLNRGFLFGPYLPVYGFGGLLMIWAMLKLKNKRIEIGGVSVTPLICYVVAVLVATAAELLTSYLMEWAIGEWLWDYTNDIPNFQGRIALKSSLRFGIMGIIGLYWLHPMISKYAAAAERKHPKAYHSLCIVLLLIFMADVIARLFLGSNYVGP